MKMLTEVEEKVGYYPDKFDFDGKIYRFGEKDVCWAVGYSLSWPKGHDNKIIICGNWSHGDDGQYKIYSNFELKAEHAAGKNKKLNALINEIKDKIKTEQLQRFKGQIDKFSNKYKKSSTNGDTAYLLKKKIPLLSPARIYNETLIIPLINFEQKLESFQFIFPDGSKRFMTDGKLNDSFGEINPDGQDDYIYLCEGFATGSSIALAFPTSKVFCALSANRIKRIAECISKFFPGKKIIICSDADKSGVGEKYAKEACSVIANCIYILPKFASSSLLHGPSDFNDLHVIEGLDLLRSQISSKHDQFYEADYEFDVLKGFTIEKGNKTFKNQQRLASFFNHKYHYISNEVGRTFIYDKTHYREVTDHEVRAFAEKYFVTDLLTCTKNDAEEFLGVIKRNNFNNFHFKNKAVEYKYINFSNGIYDIELGSIIPHSPSFFFTNVIPHNFNPNDKCPTWDEFMATFNQT